jgi:hypothetical protein
MKWKAFEKNKYILCFGINFTYSCSLSLSEPYAFKLREGSV